MRKYEEIREMTSINSAQTVSESSETQTTAKSYSVPFEDLIYGRSTQKSTPDLKFKR